MAQPFIGQIILVPYTFAPVGYAFCWGQLLPISEYDALFSLIGTTYGGDGITTFGLPDLRGRVPIAQGQGPGLSPYTIGETGGVEEVTLTTNTIPAHTHVIDSAHITAVETCRDATGNQLTPAGHVWATDPYAPFTDDPLVAGSTVVKAAHLTELRDRIDALRSGLALAPFPYTDPVLNTATVLIKAQHIVDLRTALSQAFVAAELPAPAFSDPSLSAGVTPVKAAHLKEIRAAASAATGMATYSSAPPDASMHAGAVVISGTPVAAATGGSQPHGNLQPFLALHYCIALFGIYPTQG